MADIKTDLIVKAVSEGFDKLKGDIGKTADSADKMALKMAAASQKSQSLENKTQELAAAVNRGEKSFDAAEKELSDYRKTLGDIEAPTETAKRGIGALDVALGNLAADALKKAGDAIVDFVKGSIDLASNAAETTSLIENSLGPAAVGFSEDIQKIADATNRSSIELEAGASTIIAMTRSMGFGQEAAADFSVSMAGIATDLGSFFNQSTEQVFQDIQSALAGSAETMLKYGIDVKETALKQAAFNMGLSDGKEVLDRVTRATVLQAEIQRQAADAMGDAERTADSFSNTQRGLEAATLDLQAAIGERLIPTMYKLIVASTGVVKGLNAMLSAAEQSAQLKELSSDYDELHKAILKVATEGRLLDVFESHRIEAQLTAKVLELLQAGVEGTAEELIGYAQAAIAADTRAKAMNKAFDDQVVASNDVADAIEEVTRLTVEQSRAITEATMQTGAYEVTEEQVEEAIKKRTEAQEAEIEAMKEAAAAQEELTKRTADYFQANLPAIESTDTLEAKIYDAARAAGADANELALLGVALGLFTQEQAEAALKAAALQVEIDRLGVLIAGGMGIDEALVLLDDFQARLDRRYEVNVDVTEALRRLSELQNSADALINKLAGAGGPEAPTPAPATGGAGGTGGGGGTSPTGGNLPGPGGQHGLMMTVPPGFPNDTFPLRASSGEQVTITPAGQTGITGGGGANVTVNVIIEGGRGANPYLIGREVSNQVANRLGGARG